MVGIEIAAVVVIVAGILSFADGRLDYTDVMREANISSLSLSTDDERGVDIPAWAGAGMLKVTADKTIGKESLEQKGKVRAGFGDIKKGARKDESSLRAVNE